MTEDVYPANYFVDLTLYRCRMKDSCYFAAKNELDFEEHAKDAHPHVEKTLKSFEKIIADELSLELFFAISSLVITKSMTSGSVTIDRQGFALPVMKSYDETFEPRICITQKKEWMNHNFPTVSFWHKLKSKRFQKMIVSIDSYRF